MEGDRNGPNCFGRFHFLRRLFLWGSLLISITLFDVCGPLESTRRHPRFFLHFSSPVCLLSFGINLKKHGLGTTEMEFHLLGDPFRSGWRDAAGVIFRAFLISKEAPFLSRKKYTHNFHRLPNEIVFFFFPPVGQQSPANQVERNKQKMK